ncbi:MAG: hypothetical protein R3Y49_07735 [Rikenellaceae bacterium]
MYDSARVYFVRNNHLADNASYIIAYSNGNGRGTTYTLQRAIGQGAKSHNISERNHYLCIHKYAVMLVIM